MSRWMTQKKMGCIDKNPKITLSPIIFDYGILVSNLYENGFDEISSECLSLCYFIDLFISYLTDVY